MSEDFSAWVGKREERLDRLDRARSNALLAALGRSGGLQAEDDLPLLHHWLHFWDVRAPAETGLDGHPRRGGFMPPIPLPRRMWAGGRLRFLSPIRLGDPVRRVSTIRSIASKNGRSGALVFVTVLHEIHGSAGLAIEEEQDIVYRDAGGGTAAPPAEDGKPAADWAETIEPDPVLLFRYSALTMNSHRIHYDRDYAMGAEGYPGLVVHGPLQATLLADLAARKISGPVGHFEYRGVAPAFEGKELEVRGRAEGEGAVLWTEQGGRPAMTAKAY